MRVFIAILMVSSILSASLFDFSYLSDAKEAYAQKEYEKAEKLYQKVEGDESKFNQADSLYMQKKYKEALDIYDSISDEKLAFKRLHNMGNSYAQLGKIDKAIESYEKALKIKEDEDTKFNLEFLKKKKKEQEKKDKKDKDKKDKDKKDKDKKNDKNKKDEKNRDSKDKKDKESKDKQDKKKKEDEEKKKQEEQKKKQEEQKKKQEDKDKQPQESNQTKAQPPISNMEERKWQKMLNQKGVNTLMLPLNNKGENSDKKNPW